jgi:hypothetical protein
MTQSRLTSAPTSAAGPAAQRRARVLRPWRWTLLAYGIGLTIATHWPRLKLGPEVPASDKMIHLLAFAGLTALLWRSGLFGLERAASGARRGALTLSAAAAALWAAFDELTQGIPAIGRTVTWHDVLANLCGVACAAALLWAMAPLQPPDQLAAPNRVRSRLFEFTFDEMFATWRPWLIGGAVALACAAAIALARPLLPSAKSVGVFGLGLVVIAAHVLYLIYRRMFFRRFDQVLKQQPCLACGAIGPAGEQPDLAECRTCGAMRSDLDFAAPPRPPLRAIVQVSVAPAVTALISLALLFALVLVVPAIYAWLIQSPGGGRSAAPRLAQALGRLPRELNSVIDLTVYVLLIALIVRMWRRRMAAYLDRGFRCRSCGHDLHGTPINPQGQGHCGECGEAFVRATVTSDA